MANSLGARSLTTKLSALMVIVVTVTVLAMTLQSANRFSLYILQNIEENSTTMAERTANDVSAVIENWISQISVVTSKLSHSNMDPNVNDPELESVLKNDNELLSLGLFVVDQSGAKLVRQAKQSLRIKDETGEFKTRITTDAIQKALVSTATEIASNKDAFKENRIVKNISKSLAAPSILVGLKFSFPNEENRYAMMLLIASSTKIQVSLPKSRTTESYIVDGEGAIFAFADEQQSNNSSLNSNHTLIKKALLRQAPSGFVPEFYNRENVKLLGSYAQVPGKNPLYVIIERNHKTTFQVIYRTYVNAALWGTLILLLAAMISYLTAGRVTRHLRDMVSATKQIANGDFAVRLKPDSNDEVAELGHSVNNMAQRILSLMNSEVEKARFEKELETARMVQSTFFPKKDIERTNLAITGSYTPATECGGDLWGHYTVKEGVEFVFIADAMGHGAPAALVTAIAYAVCQSVSSILAESKNIDPSPSVLLRRLNTIILDAVDGKISMTFFGALFDFNTGKMTFANAGHNFPFILTCDKEDPRLSKSAKKTAATYAANAITLTLQGNPLGVDRLAEYKEKTIDMRAGDKIVFFTDGLIENSLEVTEPMGRKNLIDSVCQYGSENIDVIKQKIIETGASIFGTENLQDDVTIVVAEISKSWNSQSSPLLVNIELDKDARDAMPSAAG